MAFLLLPTFREQEGSGEGLSGMQLHACPTALPLPLPQAGGGFK